MSKSNRYGSEILNSFKIVLILTDFTFILFFAFVSYIEEPLESFSTGKSTSPSIPIA